MRHFLLRCLVVTWLTVSSLGARAGTSSSPPWCPCGLSTSSLSPWSSSGSSSSCSPSPTTRSWPTSTTCGNTPGCTSSFRWTNSQTNYLVINCNSFTKLMNARKCFVTEMTLTTNKSPALKTKYVFWDIFCPINYYDIFISFPYTVFISHLSPISVLLLQKV